MKGNYIALLVLSFIFWGMSSVPSTILDFLCWQPAYILGFIFSDLQIRKKLSKINYNNYLKIFILISSMVLVIFIFLTYRWEEMPFMVIFLILVIFIIYLHLPNISKIIIENIGDKSLFIWLMHSCYCYHFAKDIIYYPKFLLFVFFLSC